MLVFFNVIFFSFWNSQDVRDDIGGAQSAGMQGILVRTGKGCV